ncbi:M20/M25/M40 family metallo-hydrolase, partial [Candidatus Gracilibacteria bacterium]|nr:M20/M25/M40 family metallo-hydrolase [Candidatus Gracilibacteria bacterium]
PSLELVFTVDEEVGMSGVLNLDFSLLKSKNVINIDHGNDSEVIISSAGGAGIILGKDLELFNSDDKKYDLEIFGMKGGHSGIEIHKNHGSAIEIFLKFLSSNTLINNIYSINSGTAHNVIPSQIEVILSTFQIDELKTELTKYIEEVKKIYDCPNISFKIEENNSNLQAISNGKQILSDISKIKVGVYKMSEKIPDLTETSMSLGILKTENSKINLNYLARSCINKDLKNLVDSTSEFYSSLNYKIKIDEGYPGWQDDTDSELVKITKEEITKVIGKTPKIIAIHAGLECGALVSGLGEGTHAITIGPNLYDIHSINEKVEISSVEKLEKILNGILARL